MSKNLVRLYTKSFRQFFQNWHPSVQKNKLRRQVFYGKFRLFSSIPDFEQKSNITFGKSGFGKPVKKDFYSSRETFWKKNLWKLLQKWLVSEFGQKTFGRMVKLPSRVQWNSAEKMNLLGKIKVFLSFPHIMCNSFANSNENGRVVKLAFIISIGTFWGKNKLNETVSRFSPWFDFQQKTLGRVVTPASPVSTGMFCWKKT